MILLFRAAGEEVLSDGRPEPFQVDGPACRLTLAALSFGKLLDEFRAIIHQTVVLVKVLKSFSRPWQGRTGQRCWYLRHRNRLHVGLTQSDRVSPETG